VTDYVRWVRVQSGAQEFVVCPMKDFATLMAAAGYEFHAGHDVFGSVEEAIAEIGQESDEFRGRTQ
jgi:hypothetical protein